MFLGVDYYPEQWDAKMLDEDLDTIVELGSNVIRIAEFSWHLMEKTEGNYDFSFFDHVIERAKAKGLKVIMGTPQRRSRHGWQKNILIFFPSLKAERREISAADTYIVLTAIGCMNILRRSSQRWLNIIKTKKLSQHGRSTTRSVMRVLTYVTAKTVRMLFVNS